MAERRPAGDLPAVEPDLEGQCMPPTLAWTGGRAIVATGSPFAPVELGGRRFRIGQCNNSSHLPRRRTWCLRRQAALRQRRDVDAARTLAGHVAEADLAEGALFPQLGRIRDISHAIACAVIRRGIEQGHADAKLADGLDERVRQAMWFPRYLPFRAER